VLKQSSSHNPDLIDVGEVMAAFEELNNAVLVLTGRVGKSAPEGRLSLELTAYDKNFEIGEVPSLASVRFHPGAHNHRTMESAILWALYRVDGEMARRELLGGEQK
jgi:hypothetical protein